MKRPYVLVVLLSVVLAACAPAPEANDKSGVVTFAPGITETVFALGKGDDVVAITDFCLYPEEAQGLPRLGGVFNPDLEKLAALKPAMIIVPGPSSTEKLNQFAERLGITVVDGFMDSLDTIDSGIQRIGDAVGAPGEAQLLRGEITAQLAAIRNVVANQPHPNVLIVSSRDTHTLDSVFTVGGTSFLSELVDVAGGVNIFASASQPYFEASKETIVNAGPAVIIEFHAGAALSEAERDQYRADWDALPGLPAVADGRVYILTEDYALIPGPRIVDTARLIAQALHNPGGLADLEPAS